MKVWKKAVSVLLALVMTLSLATAAFAADGEKTYTPAYSDTLSEETVADLVADLDILLSRELWGKVVEPLFSNATIASLYGLFGTLNGVNLEVTSGVTLQFPISNEAGAPPASNYFKALDSELFASLPADVADVGNVDGKNLLAEIDYGVTDVASFFAALEKALVPMIEALNYSQLPLISQTALQLIATILPHLNTTLSGLGIVANDVVLKALTNESGMPMTYVAVMNWVGPGSNDFEPTGERRLAPMFWASSSAVCVPTDLRIKDGTETYFANGLKKMTAYFYQEGVKNPKKLAVSQMDTIHVTEDGVIAATAPAAADGSMLENVPLYLKPMIGGNYTPALASLFDYADAASQVADYVEALYYNLSGSTVSTLMNGIAGLADAQNRVDVSAIFIWLSNFINDNSLLFSQISSMMPEVGTIIDMVKRVIVLKDSSIEGARELDLVATINALCQEKLIPTQEVDADGNVINKAIGLTLNEINWANLSPDMSAADTFMVVYHYLYSNLIGNKDNLNAVASLLTDLANLDISPYLGLIETLDSDALLATVAGMVAGIAHPAISVEDPETGITIDAESDKIVPADAVLKVEKVTSGEAYDKAADALKDAEQFLLFDISLINNDLVEIQPNGTIKVKIPLPEGYDGAKVLVYRVEADGTLTDMKAVVEEGYLVFETDHLSLYAVAQMKDVVAPGGDAEDPTEPGDPVDTGDTALSVVACVSLAAAAAFVITRRKHA